MKRIFYSALAICLVAVLCACSSDFSLDTAGVVRIDGTDGKGHTVQIVDSDAIATIFSDISEGKPKATSDSVPEKDAFRLTTYDENNTAVHIITLYNDSLLQIGENLYKGDFEKLGADLPSYFSVSKISDLSPLFGMSEADISEISVYNVKKKVFKTVTDPVNIATVTQSLNKVFLKGNTPLPESDPYYYVYYRLRDSDKYEPPVGIIPAKGCMILSCCGKRCLASSCDIAAIYNKLTVNAIPIPNSFFE